MAHSVYIIHFYIKRWGFLTVSKFPNSCLVMILTMPPKAQHI